MRVRAEEISHLMKAGCGESDPRTLRAEELSAAVQRLQWAMERASKGETPGTIG